MTRIQRDPNGPQFRNNKRIGVILGIGLIVAAPGIAHAVQTVPNPSGNLLFRRDLSIPENPVATGSTFTNADVTHDDGINAKLLNDNESCGLAWDPSSTDDDNGEFHPYTTDTVRILTAGKYTFRIVNSPGINDPFLAVLSGTFDKANPDAGILGCNDDFRGTDVYTPQDGDAFDNNGIDSYAYPPLNAYWSHFEVDLQPGIYTVMLSSFQLVTDDAGWYQNFGDVVASTYQGTATSTFEYWGPPNGMEIVEPSSEYRFNGSLQQLIDQATDLPNTGSPSQTLGIVLASAMVGLGSILVVTSRRRFVRT